MRVAGTDGLVVAMKPGNAGGAKGPDTPAAGRGQPVMGGGAAVRGTASMAGVEEPDEARASRPVL